MKTKDFDRLKQICEQEGFELLNESPFENDKFFVVKKKIEKIEVEFNTSGGFQIEDNSTWKYSFEFTVKNKPEKNLHQYGKYLAQQLENHLNETEN